MIGVLMKYLVCDFYDNFECIGSQCPSTCCAGWDILIDKETNAFYDSVAGEFGDALRKIFYPLMKRSINLHSVKTDAALF